MAQNRRIVWLNVITVISAAILIGAEVFGAAFAGSWAIATLFDLGGVGARVLDVVLQGHAEMWSAMRERDAIYANPEAGEAEFLHAAELEAKYAEYGGYTAESRAGELLLGLGVPIEQVTVVHGDTDKVQFGMGTYGSRSGAVGMSAIYRAIDKVIVKAKKVAGFVLEVPEETVDFNDGIFSSKATNKTLTFPEVALQAYVAHKFSGQQLEPGLKEGAFYDPTNFTFPAGAYICEMEVDSATGKSTFVNFVAADDFGRLINPMIVEGQVHGGLAQGIGQALWEQCVVDPAGQPLCGSFMDYGTPRSDQLPSFVTKIVEVLSPTNPLGIKAGGEGGTTGAPAAIVSAIADALAPYGIDDIKMPVTPYRIWDAIQNRKTPTSL